jgi:hypothetical protein
MFYRKLNIDTLLAQAINIRRFYKSGVIPNLALPYTASLVTFTRSKGIVNRQKAIGKVNNISRNKNQEFNNR